MRYAIAVVFLCCIPFFAVAQQVKDTTKNNVEKAVEEFLKDPDLKNIALTFHAVEVSTRKAVASYNAEMSIVPASCMKLITTATALEILGGGYKFKTVIQYSGTLDTVKRVLNGDVFILGGGDPTLGSKYFAKDDPSAFLIDWARAIKAAGIDSITGNIIADAEIYGWEMVPSTWAWGDLGNGYGAAPCGVSIYDNTCVLKFNTGSKAGDTARIECVMPYVPDLEFSSDVYAGNTTDDNAYIFGAPYSYQRVVKGVLPKGKEAFEVKGTIPDPSYLAAFELMHALLAEGVAVGGRPNTVREMKMKGAFTSPVRTDIYTHYSPAVASIVNLTNTFSVNLFAEHLINQIGLVKYGNGTVGSGAAAMLEFWAKKGIDTKGLYITDGSGLSRFDAVSASHFVQILLWMTQSKSFSTFEKSLPVAGRSGTLSGFCKGTRAEGKVAAKSGTMTRVKAYSGYVTSKAGKRIAFSVVVNNFNCSTKQMEKKLEKIMVALVDYV